MAESRDRVLIANDDETVQSVLFKVVGSNGIDAIIASGGEEALKPAARSRDVETPIIIFVI